MLWGSQVGTLALLATLLPVGNAQVSTPGDKPLPDLHQLLLELDRHQKIAEARARDYTYHVHMEDQDLDGQGNLKKTGSTDAESLTIDGIRINRVVAKDGKPLTPEEQRKENERIDKDVQKVRERRQKRAERGEETNSRGDVLIPASRFLELGRFTNPRRVSVNGRPTIQMDYAGDPNVKTHGPTEGIIRDLVGEVWIDEADRVLVQGEGHFLNDFKIAGGLLASIHKGFSFEFRAAKVNDDAWLPASFAGQGSARILLFRSIHGRLRATMSDYRKFRAGVTIGPASHVLDENGQPMPERPVSGTGQPAPAKPDEP